MSDDVVEIVQQRLANQEQPTPQEIKALLERIHIADAFMEVCCVAVGDVEQERDAYAWLVHANKRIQAHLRDEGESENDDSLHHISLENMQESYSYYYPSKWKYNIREFFEKQIQGWRAIVSSNSEDHLWVAYVERQGVRFYATKRYRLIQDALNWCVEEVAWRSYPTSTEEQELL